MNRKFVNYSWYLVLLLIVSACSNDMKNLQELNIQKKYPQGEAYDFKLVYTDSTKVMAELVSPLNRDFTNQRMPYSEFPEGLKLTFYDAQRHKNTVEAKYGIIYPSSDMVELRDSVVLSTFDGKQLLTSQLFWDQKEDWIFTDREFSFTDRQKGTVTKGIGMDFNKQFSTVRAHKTTGILSVEEKD